GLHVAGQARHPAAGGIKRAVEAGVPGDQAGGQQDTHGGDHDDGGSRLRRGRLIPKKSFNAVHVLFLLKFSVAVSMANCSFGLFSRLPLANCLTRPSLSDGFADVSLALMVIYSIAGKG